MRLSVAIWCSAWITGVLGIARVRRDSQVSIGHGPRILTFSDTVPKPHPKLSPSTEIFNWVQSEGLPDGFHAKISNASDFVLENIVTSEQRILIEKAKVPSGNSGFSLNSDASQVIWAVNQTKGWRHSFTANYLVQNVKTGDIRPLVADQNEDIQLVVWNPKKPDNLAFVRGNNLHLWENFSVIPITRNGSPTMFNGVADWVYEEEVISGTRTIWFSPDGERIAYLSFDDSQVPVHTMPLFMQSKPKTAAIYPREVNIRYPKPGFPNPVVSAYITSVSSPAAIETVPLDMAFAKDNIVVGEVAWVTDKHDSVIFRCFNRVQNNDKHLLFDVNTSSAKIVRERNAKDGWLENQRVIKYVGKLPATGGKDEEYYLDLSDQDGWNHLYIFNVQGNKSRQLTHGEWEVNSIKGVNLLNHTAYFLASERHPTEQQLFQISMINRQQKSLVEDTPAYWSASFSPNATYYVLSYDGPNLPYQELYRANQTDKPIKVIKDNKAVRDVLRTYQLPKYEYLDLPHPSGFNLSAQITYPASFNSSRKYPVLLVPYGGPNSQEVKKKYNNPGIASFIVSNKVLDYVVVTVDNRGTGQRGRAFRNAYYKNVGVVEPEDQIWSAEWLIKQYPWVDKDRVGIWGWSNGGYIAAKVVEIDTKGVFSFAIATAPTSDPRLYDSIYTERYLGSLEENPAAYERATIRNTTNFNKIAGGVLFQHGTGDDNVHWIHTAALVERLMAARVPPTKLRAQFFPDSDHSIDHDNQQVFMFQQLAWFLQEQKLRRVDKQQKHSWEMYDFASRQEEIGEMRSRQNVLLEDDREELTLGGSFYA